MVRSAGRVIGIARAAGSAPHDSARHDSAQYDSAQYDSAQHDFAQYDFAHSIANSSDHVFTYEAH